jgi:hypothetical protein
MVGCEQPTARTEEARPSTLVPRRERKKAILGPAYVLAHIVLRCLANWRGRDGEVMGIAPVSPDRVGCTGVRQYRRLGTSSR